MTIKLNDYWSERLAQMPETGMGYQKVDVEFKDGGTLKGLLAFNAEDLETEQEFRVADIVSITLHNPQVRHSE